MILTACPNPSVDKQMQFDSFRTGAIHNASSTPAWPGGKGVHVALAVAELEESSALTGFWGGPPGQWIRQKCEEAGIPCSGPEMEEWTRTCLTILSEDTGEETEIREPGPPVTAAGLEEFFQDVERLLPGSSALCVSGSWPPHAPVNVYERLQVLAKKASIPLWVDASGDRLRQAIRVHPEGIHINRSEAAELFGEGGSPVEYTRQLLHHCNVAAVTDGANGLFLARGKEMIHARCKAERVITTTGCGDCLLAGLLVQGGAGDLESMARSGTASGTANCLIPGPGMIRKQDVDRLRSEVVTNRIS